MKRLRDYLGLIALVVGIALPVLGWLNTQSRLNKTVADLASAMLTVQAWQDSTAKQDAIDAAVREILLERGDRHRPSRAEIIGKLAEGAPKADTAKTAPIERRQARIKRYTTLK